VQLRSSEWKGILCHEPCARGGDGSSVYLSVATATGIEMLSRAIGPPLLQGLRGPLEAWHKLSEVRGFVPAVYLAMTITLEAAELSEAT
jgi:hypothetical protein